MKSEAECDKFVEEANKLLKQWRETFSYSKIDVGSIVTKQRKDSKASELGELIEVFKQVISLEEE